MKITVISEDQECLDLLKENIRRYAQENGTETDVQVCEQGPTDLVFLDVDRPGTHGTDTAKRFRRKPQAWIAVTAGAYNAVRGYEEDAVDVLVRPFSHDRFAEAMERAVRTLPPDQDMVTINGKDGALRCHVHDILYAEVRGREVCFHLNSRTVRIRTSLAAVEEQLKEYRFLRLSGSCLVNPAHIDQIAGKEVYIGEQVLALARLSRKRFLSELAAWYDDGKA